MEKKIIKNNSLLDSQSSAPFKHLPAFLALQHLGTAPVKSYFITASQKGAREIVEAFVYVWRRVVGGETHVYRRKVAEGRGFLRK